MKLVGIAVILFGCLSGVLFFAAGFDLASTGKELTQLRSVGGTSVAESYYQSVGKYGKAASGICFALGLGTMAISLGIGGRLFFSK